MDFAFPPAQDAFRQEVRDFISRHLDPHWPGDGDGMWDDRDDATWSMARSFFKKLAEKSWLALSWPKDYGGGGRSVIEQNILIEELAYAGGPGIDMGVTFVGPSVLLHGTEEDKRRLLPPIARGDVTYCEGLSEPNSGSDLASLTTRAVRDGARYVIDGQKIWTSVAHRADFVWLAARTDPDAPPHKGISCFLVDMKTPGITVEPIPNMIGIHSFNQVFFEHVIIPKGSLIGKENEGWSQIMTTLDYERAIFGAGVGNVAAMRRHLEDLVVFMRSSDYRPATSPVRASHRHQVASLAVDLETCRTLAYRVVWLHGQGKVPDAEVSMAKVFSSELALRLAHTAVDILGPWGLLWPDSRHAYANGRPAMHLLTSVGYPIGAGTSEIQRNIIAARGLGLPRR